ncbi:hypothetical protein F383_00679 [Gossypium arboreum]|uniref:Uncharacterized protein n=1 Tax=Gossypium arboreum TaxID=29729 RepID=A0A0B0PL45_GOSAR|nr:hypothetical protein F383_00679 [Gossypium arboreum]
MVKQKGLDFFSRACHVNLAGSKHDLHGWITRPCPFNSLDHGLQ